MRLQWRSGYGYDIDSVKQHIAVISATSLPLVWYYWSGANRSLLDRLSNMHRLLYDEVIERSMGPSGNVKES